MFEYGGTVFPSQSQPVGDLMKLRFEVIILASARDHKTDAPGGQLPDDPEQIGRQAAFGIEQCAVHIGGDETNRRHDASPLSAVCLQCSKEGPACQSPSSRFSLLSRIRHPAAAEPVILSQSVQGTRPFKRRAAFFGLRLHPGSAEVRHERLHLLKRADILLGNPFLHLFG